MRFHDFVGEITPTPTPTAPGATSMTPGQPTTPDPAIQQKMMAQQALDRANKKKELQDAIKSKQQELQDLQKQLAALR